MSGIRYTISGLMLFFIFKINSIKIFDKKRKQTKKIEISRNNQRDEKKTNLIQITSCCSYIDG